MTLHATAESATAEPTAARQVAGRSACEHSETTRSQTDRSETAQSTADPARPEPARPDPARPDPARPEPARRETARSEGARSEDAGTEPARSEDAGTETARTEDTRTGDPRAAEAPTDNARSGDAHSGDARSGDARSGDARSARSRRRSVRWRWALGAATVLALVVLFRQMRNIDITGVFSHALVGRACVAIALSILPLIGSALALLVLSPTRLPAGPTLVAQTATSFVNVVTPAGTGGLALLTRFLQRRRVPASRAVATVALVQATSVLCSLLGVMVAALVTGRRVDLNYRLPAPLILVGIAVAAAVAAGVSWICFRRYDRVFGRLFRRLFTELREMWRQAWHVLVRQPHRLLGSMGAGLITLIGSALTMRACVWTYDADISMANVVLVVAIGTAIGTAAPVPGGIGTVETSLAAGLALAGVEPLAAVFAAVLYRVIIFWGRVPLGWGCLMWLRRAKHV